MGQIDNLSGTNLYFIQGQNSFELPWTVIIFIDMDLHRSQLCII